MSKHTPGPWTFDNNPEESMIYVHDENHRFDARIEMHSFNCGPRHVGQKKKLRAEVEANARLITAAPDLLEALRRLSELATKFCVSGVYFAESWKNTEALHAADDAIAKATGEAA